MSVEYPNSVTSLDKKPQVDLENVIEDASTSSEHRVAQTENLNRSLGARTINLICLGGVIGTGIFLGMGKMLLNAGPLGLLLNYLIMGSMIYFMMLSLGEMSVQYPISGSFAVYTKRFGSDSLAFATLFNYWLNDCVSVAADLVALQLVMQYWTNFHWYVISIIFWVFLLLLNVLHVRLYAEAEYSLALLKVVTIIIFFIVSIICNAGKNPQHEYIGFKYWSYGDAPFVDGIRGFSKVFASAAYSFGGLESVSLTAGETKNPTRVIPKTVQMTFFRVLIFYILTAFFIGMNIPYDYPNLLTKKVATSPFTIVFQMVGAKGAGSFMNAVIMTSIVSAGNHALYAGSRLAYNLSLHGYIPKIFLPMNRFRVPYVAVIITWLIGGLCFASAFVGSGELWSWLQAIVGLSNLISWWVIGVVSIRFRRGLEKQGRTHELLFKNWSYPYGPLYVVILGGFIILVQGWTTFSPFSVNDFFQSYLELGVFPLCFVFWWLVVRKGKDKFVKFEDMDFDTDRYYETPEEVEKNRYANSLKGWAKFKYNFADNFL